MFEEVGMGTLGAVELVGLGLKKRSVISVYQSPGVTGVSYVGLGLLNSRVGVGIGDTTRLAERAGDE